jgi:hypothetical protein
MAIIGTLPVTLTNGTLADATQVMSDFNFIVAQVNANSASLAGGNAFTGAQTIAGDWSDQRSGWKCWCADIFDHWESWDWVV